jgi:type IV pilus assembly protein PilA
MSKVLEIINKRPRSLKDSRGFTLIEIILVVAIIAILAGIVIIAVNPSKQLADGRNSQRRSDVNTILNATYQYSVDSNGTLPAGISTTPTEICKTTGCPGMVDLSALTSAGKYLVSIPFDPKSGTGFSGTGYKIFKDANGRLTVDATMNQENSPNPDISVTR